MDLWDIHDGTGHLPTQEELDAVLPLIRSDDLLVEEGRAYLAREGMIANLGAIAKGYIADKVKEVLIDQGVAHAVLDLGHNILLIGDKAQGQGFTVAIRDPNSQENSYVDIVSATDKSVVTSGIDQRNFTYEGKTYHHILDPFTGFPADNGLASVTILSNTSAQGDALSTSCFLLGPEQGWPWWKAWKTWKPCLSPPTGSCSRPPATKPTGRSSKNTTSSAKKTAREPFPCRFCVSYKSVKISKERIKLSLSFQKIH